jgi:hypothetical protein
VARVESEATVTQNKSTKRIVRDLQELRGCSYTTALNELRALPEGSDWKAYVMGVAKDDRTIPKSAAVRAVAAIGEAMDRNPAEPQPCAWWDWSEPNLVRCKTGKPAAFEHPKFGRVCEDHRLA